MSYRRNMASWPVIFMAILGSTPALDGIARGGAPDVVEDLIRLVRDDYQLKGRRSTPSPQSRIANVADFFGAIHVSDITPGLITQYELDWEHGRVRAVRRPRRDASPSIGACNRCSCGEAPHAVDDARGGGKRPLVVAAARLSQLSRSSQRGTPRART